MIESDFNGCPSTDHVRIIPFPATGHKFSLPAKRTVKYTIRNFPECARRTLRRMRIGFRDRRKAGGHVPPDDQTILATRRQNFAVTPPSHGSNCSFVF